MTVKQFFKEVRKLRGKFEVKGGEIRTKRERYTKLGGYRCLCPIEELYRAQTKKVFNGSLDYAEKALGLGRRDSYQIVDAADVPRAAYRKPLLKALGLKEV